jgi:4-hydroxy-tetrahydrodipicolinate synthase
MDLISKPMRGVIVATVLPFREDGGIDWKSYERLMAYCVKDRPVAAVFVNGHAGEGASLLPEERADVIRFVRGQVGADMPILSGVMGQSTAEAIAQALGAREAGADCAVLFPPPSFQGGAATTPAVPVQFVRSVHRATGMPISFFQYPLSTGYGLSTETLLAIAREPGMIMIKEGSGDISVYETNWNLLKAEAPHVSIMGTSASWIWLQVAAGADGILSGLGSLAPDWLMELWEAGEACDLAAMRAVNEKLRPLGKAIYGGTPRMDLYTRTKVVLRELGIIECARPRAPLLPLTPENEARLFSVLDIDLLRPFAAKVLEGRPLTRAETS